METNVKNQGNLDDIVFENRNKSYGAYRIRKAYNKDMTIAIFIAMSFFIVVIGSSWLFANHKSINSDNSFVVTGVFDKYKTEPDVKPPVPPKLPDLKIEKERLVFKAPKVVDSLDKKMEDMLTMQDLTEKLPQDSVETPDIVDVGNDNNNKVIDPPTSIIYSAPEEMPVFPGGDEALLKYFAENTKYPPECKEIGVEGKVLVEFVIDENGNITDVKVVRSVDKLLDNEALRVIKGMPQWEPGRQGGQKVKVRFGLPIVFKLRN
jgi:periplasmic protein TonB